MRKVQWFLSWLLCWLFGHTGRYFDSGYHVCSRCGLHGYWSFRETSGQRMLIEYSNAGWLVALWETVTLYRWRLRRERERFDKELPF
jgi:hypothetical protein